MPDPTGHILPNSQKTQHNKKKDQQHLIAERLHHCCQLRAEGPQVVEHSQPGAHPPAACTQKKNTRGPEGLLLLLEHETHTILSCILRTVTPGPPPAPRQDASTSLFLLVHSSPGQAQIALGSLLLRSVVVCRPRSSAQRKKKNGSSGEHLLPRVLGDTAAGDGYMMLGRDVCGRSRSSSRRLMHGVVYFRGAGGAERRALSRVASQPLAQRYFMSPASCVRVWKENI